MDCTFYERPLACWNGSHFSSQAFVYGEWPYNSVDNDLMPNVPQKHLDYLQACVQQTFEEEIKGFDHSEFRWTQTWRRSKNPRERLAVCHLPEISFCGVEKFSAYEAMVCLQGCLDISYAPYGLHGKILGTDRITPGTFLAVGGKFRGNTTTFGYLHRSSVYARFRLIKVDKTDMELVTGMMDSNLNL